MKPKSVDSRGRSTGRTRTPAWPTTIGMPSVTPVIGTHRAAPAAGFNAMPQSISWSDVDPAAPEADLGALVGRAVEVLGEGAGDVGRDGPGVLGVDRRGAVLDQVAEDRVDRFGAVGPDRDPGVARVGPADADLALADLERAPHLEDAVEDLGQSSESTM